MLRCYLIDPRFHHRLGSIGMQLAENDHHKITDKPSAGLGIKRAKGRCPPEMLIGRHDSKLKTWKVSSQEYQIFTTGI